MRALLPVLAFVLAAPVPVRAQSASRDWRPEDRAVIGDFSRVTTVAAAQDRVFITSPSALLVWRPLESRWEAPIEPPEPGYLARAFAALPDPLDQSLWLARPDGWVHYQPDIRLWDQGAVPEGVLGVAFDADDPVAGLYLRTRSGWLLLPRGGLLATPSRPPARPVAPATVEEAVRAAPALQANAAAILTDRGLRTARYTAAARAHDGRGWYLGTSGVGVLYLPDAAALPERLSFGLPSNRVAAVLSWPGGVWAGTDRTALADAAVTYVASSLDRFRSLPEGSAVGAPFTRVRRIAGQGRVLWAATDAGVARIEIGDGRIQMVDEGRGLPDGLVHAVVARRGRITVGTGRGVAQIDDTLRVDRPAPRFDAAAYAVFAAGDSVWIGTAGGLLLALPGQEGAVRPAAAAGAGLEVPIVRLATMGDTLVALTRDQLLWRDPRSGAWTLGPNLSALLGRLRSFVVDGPGAWVAGERGVGFARLDGPPLHPLLPGDLPGPVNDLAVDEQHLWVATEGGLVRFRLDAVRP